MRNYFFSLLRVDLTQRKVREERIYESMILKFLGGSGLGAKILFDKFNPSAAPLSSENKLLFLAGPLVGTGDPWCVKYTVMTRSPFLGQS